MQKRAWIALSFPLFGLAVLATAYLWFLGAPWKPATITFLHMNDVYEIDAVAGGHAGGLARVATIRHELRSGGADVLTTLGGDFLSPSAIGTARVDGQPLAGKQMVEVLNAVGVDVATLGNHEFDVSEAAFRARMSEAKFQVVAANVSDGAGKHFEGLSHYLVMPMRAGGSAINVGVIGLTTDSNPKPWVKYAPVIETARAQVQDIRKYADIVVMLTHLTIAQDQALVTEVPGIDLVLGGHEHENWVIERGPNFTPIVKADANARTVAIVTMTIAKKGVRPTVSVRMQPIDDSVAIDPAVDAVVKHWTKIGFDAFRQDGFTPESVVATTAVPLDGREAIVRNGSSALTDLITAGMMREANPVDVAIFNSGSIRIDDVLTPGPVTEYDIIRVLPFGGKILKATFDGALLAQVLDQGVKNHGSGGYLQTAGVSRVDAGWLVQGKPINPTAKYSVAISDYLLTGAEIGLGFLTDKNPHVHDVTALRDIRQAVIAEMKARQ